MALTATASQGFEKHRTVESAEVCYVPATAGTTYTVGDACLVASSGLLAKATANQVPTCVVAKTTVCAAQTVAFPDFSGFDSIRDDTALSRMLSLVPVEPLCAVGTKILRSTFKDHKDDVATGYTASTRELLVTTGMAANDYPNGALIYVYEGPGAGEMNLVEDYVHGSLAITLYRPFIATLTSASKIIVISGEAVATRGIHQLGLCGVADHDEIECDDHANDGKRMFYESWEKLPVLLKKLQIPTTSAAAFA
jgi:hypothetical protein